MNKTASFQTVSIGLCATLAMLCSGCSKQEAVEKMNEAEVIAEKASDTIAEDVSKVVEEGEEMASGLGDKAMAFLSPLKDKLGNLESLKEKPEELKKAVAELIQSIENKAEGIELPESVSNALATTKQKLVELKEYLEGEVDQAKIDERIQEIKDSLKSGLSLSGK
ncbi:hypothetical protein [Novipirellula artificiosorum]|uniref:Uncharacterized protein n=1 Tax=Novipirellula artificiosorum TaxID=2528016 RepID=A0A5C6D8C8_9BACT|nr:hypothetical protein [Novipirellula artificiosorum]TWU31957.1 hypothetical protein Poly41_58450 [Novipirellula artificiosorum]